MDIAKQIIAAADGRLGTPSIWQEDEQRTIVIFSDGKLSCSVTVTADEASKLGADRTAQVKVDSAAKWRAEILSKAA